MNDIVAAQGSNGVDIPGLAPGMLNQILSQGLLGIAVIFLLYVIHQLWKELKAEREKCTLAYTDMLAMGAKIAQSNSDVARALDKRGEQTVQIMQANDRLAQSIDHLGVILELQHNQVTETLREIKAK